MRKQLAVVFASGAFGGFVEAMFFYLFSMAGVVTLFGMHRRRDGSRTISIDL